MRAPSRLLPRLVFVALGLFASGSTLACGRPHARTGVIAGDQVTLGDEVRHVGEIRVHKTEQAAALKMLVADAAEKPPKMVLVESLDREVRRDEVLAVEGPDAKKLRVTYLEKSKASSTNGKAQMMVYPVVGKVFLVERLVGRTVVTHEDGTPLGLGEEEIVADDYKSDGPTPEKLEAELRKPMRIGDRIEALAALLRRGLPANVAEAKVDVVLTGVRDNPLGQVAVFSVAIDAVGLDGDAKIAMSLKGELLVRVSDGASIGSDLGGDLAMARPPAEDQAAIKGVGRIRFTEKTEMP